MTKKQLAFLAEAQITARKLRKLLRTNEPILKPKAHKKLLKYLRMLYEGKAKTQLKTA